MTKENKELSFTEAFQRLTLSTQAFSKETSAGRYKYVTLDQIMIELRKHLVPLNLGLMFDTSAIELGGKTYMEVKAIVFRGEDCQGSSAFMPYESILRGGNPAQDMGALISYGKRYALSNLLGLIMVGEDDDARCLTVQQAEKKPAFEPNALIKRIEAIDSLERLEKADKAIMDMAEKAKASDSDVAKVRKALENKAKELA